MMRKIPCTLAVLALLSQPLPAEEAGAAPKGPDPSPKEVTPETQRAISRGLAFLARRQSKDGSWSDSAYRRHVGITAIACMAMLSQGNLPGRGKYGAHVKRAVDFLLRSVDRQGLIVGSQVSHGPMYGHGFAALCLAEVYGMTGDEKIARKLKKAVELIVRTQNAQGGWRYQPTSHGADLSVTICQVQALRAARNAGILVPQKTVKKAIEYVKASATDDGGFSYMIRSGRSSLALTGAGVTALYGLGEDQSAEAKRGVKYLSSGKSAWRLGHYYYGHYYAAQAMYQAGGEHWAKWYPKVRKEILGKQRSTDGSFQGEIGPIYATGMALIILQIPYRYLPILQR